MEELTWMHWSLFYLIAGLALAVGCAASPVGRKPDWGWGPAIMVILGWFPLIFLLLFTNRYTKGK